MLDAIDPGFLDFTRQDSVLEVHLFAFLGVFHPSCGVLLLLTISILFIISSLPTLTHLPISTTTPATTSTALIIRQESQQTE